MKSIYQVAADQKARELSPAQLLDLLRQFAADIESEGRTHAPAVMREAAIRLEAIALRDWAVRVLDAWAAQEHRQSPSPTFHFEGYWFLDTGWGRFTDQSADGVRIAAAEEAWSELPESGRKRIGARP